MAESSKLDERPRDICMNSRGGSLALTTIDGCHGLGGPGGSRWHRKQCLHSPTRMPALEGSGFPGEPDHTPRSGRRSGGVRE
jgi:hypothetical protein